MLPRSGLAIEHGITCVNAPGLVDPNYRGELRVILDQPRHASRSRPRRATGSRSCCWCPFVAPELVVVDELPDGGDDRGTGGFGSSGR